jgi:hypothetical protein
MGHWAEDDRHGEQGRLLDRALERLASEATTATAAIRERLSLEIRTDEGHRKSFVFGPLGTSTRLEGRIDDVDFRLVGSPARILEILQGAVTPEEALVSGHLLIVTRAPDLPALARLLGAASA